MEVKEKYTDLEDRAVKVKFRESQGFRMLHDNFDDPNWKHGDPLVGTMTFTNEVPLPTPEDIIAQKRIEAQARAIQAIKDNAGAAPWGKIFKDLAIAQGLIEPE